MTTPLTRLRAHLPTPLQHTLQTHPYLASALAASASLALPLLYADYRAFLALGPGGLPYNALGWLANLLVLRPLALSHAARLNVDDYPPASEAGVYVREELSVRAGPRAETAGIVPHRQVSQVGPLEMRGRVEGVLRGLVEGSGGKLEIRRSHYELRNEALYVVEGVWRGDGQEGSRVPRTARVAKGEAAHVHTDRSVHLYLHPADARVVIEKGWGERHRLSRSWPWWLGGGQAKLGLGHTWIMLYGARNEEELEVTRRLIGEGVTWMLGEREE